MAFEPLWLPFDHPLWIVYSSGTTGLPKPIVHGHGGTVLVALALKTLHNDVGCATRQLLGRALPLVQLHGLGDVERADERPAQRHHLLHFDGNPGGRTVDEAGQKVPPDWSCLWRFAASVGATFLARGGGAANCQKAGGWTCQLCRAWARFAPWAARARPPRRPSAGALSSFAKFTAPTWTRRPSRG